MVDKYVTLRSKLTSKIFTPYGKSVTFKKKISPTYNTRGEIEVQTYTDSTVTIVPYNIIDARQSFEAFGAIQEGEMDAAVPYTVDVAIDDVFTIESIDYKVKNIENNWLPENVVTIVRLSKIQN